MPVKAAASRQISTAAGMRIAGAVANHFGDKVGLIRAIIDDRVARIDERRHAMLVELERQGRTCDLRAVAEAGIRPFVEEIGETGYYIDCLVALYSAPPSKQKLEAPRISSEGAR